MAEKKLNNGLIIALKTHQISIDQAQAAKAKSQYQLKKTERLTREKCRYNIQ